VGSAALRRRVAASYSNRIRRLLISMSKRLMPLLVIPLDAGLKGRLYPYCSNFKNAIS
jgi:hypothetical protein